VSRDERLHREQAEKEDEGRRKRNNLERIRMMKVRMNNRVGDYNGDSGDGDGDGRNDQQRDQELTATHSVISPGRVQSTVGRNEGENKLAGSKHVNLFEKEEKDMLESKILGKCASSINCANLGPCTMGGKKLRQQEQQQQSVGIMPVFLTENPGCRGSISKGNKNGSDNPTTKKEFYEREDCLKKVVDDKVKLRLDPMSKFVSKKINDDQRKQTVSNETSIQNHHNDHDRVNQRKKKRRKESRRMSRTKYHSSSDSSSVSSSSTTPERKNHKKKHRRSSSRSKHKKDRKRMKSLSKEKKDSSHSLNKTKNKMEELMARKKDREQREDERERKVIQKRHA